LKSSPFIERIFEAFRQVVPFIDHDQVMYPHIARSVEFLQQYVEEFKN
jgi:histidine ammonia-lyase